MDKHFKTIAILLMCFVLQSSPSEDADIPRMIVYKNESHFYDIKGESFFDFPMKMRVTDQIFGSEKTHESALKDEGLTCYPGFQFAFVHPVHAGFIKGEESEVKISERFKIVELASDGSQSPGTLTLRGKATCTSSDWKYDLKTDKKSVEQVYLKCEINGENFVVLIKSLDFSVSTTFDKKSERVKTVSIKYKWTLDKPIEESVAKEKRGTTAPQVNKVRLDIIKKWRGKFSHTVSLKYGGEDKKFYKKKPIVSNPRHAKAIELCEF